MTTLAWIGIGALIWIAICAIAWGFFAVGARADRGAERDTWRR